MGLTERNWEQSRLIDRPLTLAERFEIEHGKWYRDVLAKEKGDERAKGVRAFNLGDATGKQLQAIDEYLENQGKSRGRGLTTWMKWNELTYYDILQMQSPK